jgi:DNA mismatch endonuclease Vsr
MVMPSGPNRATEMTDKIDRQTRSKMMSAVRAKNTKIETEIRRRIFAQGFRYRLHARELPGNPDMVFPKYSVLEISGPIPTAEPERQVGL